MLTELGPERSHGDLFRHPNCCVSLGLGPAWARARLGPGRGLGVGPAWVWARLGPRPAWARPGLGPGVFFRWGPGPALHWCKNVVQLCVCTFFAPMEKLQGNFYTNAAPMGLVWM